ncbi:hypothetical protein KP509_33G026400 [Ceratopteris richardii]|uniref:Chloroplast envelope membrane protein n=1 Tax=Ceratopteris richardii TaxID=49495 RepID=A0A8T2QNK9_CERRI|nr:hypothetical protein KP509_33G026400 [Ceratopteris richardii]
MITQSLQLPSLYQGHLARERVLELECIFSSCPKPHHRRQNWPVATVLFDTPAPATIYSHWGRSLKDCTLYAGSEDWHGYPHACKLGTRLHFVHFSCSSPKQPWIFRVSAQKEDSGNSWLRRFLFSPINPNDYYPFLISDTEEGDESEDAPESASDSVEDESKESTDDEWCEDEIDRMLADDRKFAEWQQRVKAQNELRESQVAGRNPDNEDWEDWLDDSWGDYSAYVGGKDSGWYFDESDWEKGGLPRSPPKLPERGMSRNMKELFLRFFEDEEEVKEDLAFEDRVFRFTSQTTVKFVAVLVVVPLLVSYISHDFLIVPFLNRWVETVPLAAELFDLRRSQKLNIVESLKLERQRIRFEAAIGKAPPLNDEELLEHIRDEALELSDELRLENRKAFGNIFSDILAGVTVLLLLVFNPDRVAIMRLTGYRILTNISDTGKAFLLILLSDIFLGYHSESGWETLVEFILEHYGIEVDQAAIYLFVAIVPVTIDACFKLWVFRYFTRMSPSAAATFKEMKRH